MNGLKYFVNLKSNSALLYNKGHNLLASAFTPKLVKLIKFPLIGKQPTHNKGGYP